MRKKGIFPLRYAYSATLRVYRFIFWPRGCVDCKIKVFVNINLASLEIIFGSVVRNFSLQMPHTDALYQIWLNTKACRNIADLTCLYTHTLLAGKAREKKNSNNLVSSPPKRDFLILPVSFVSSSCEKKKSAVVTLTQGCTFTCAPSTVKAGKCLCCYMRKDTNRKANYGSAVIYLSTIWQEHSTAKYMAPP